MFTDPKEAARALAPMITGGRIDPESIIARCAVVLGRKPRWLKRLAKRLVADLGLGRRPKRRRIHDWLLADKGFACACARESIRVQPEDRPRPTMQPADGPPSSWPVPPIPTVGELARWLRLDPEELAWFADPHGFDRDRSEGPLHHYNYRLIAKRDGSRRLLESPKLRLKLFQRRILDSILIHLPPHPAAHGFRAGRSIRSFTLPHVGQDFVLRLDLKDFFASVHRGRVLAILLTAGYPEPVASWLAGLCTHRTPRAVLRRWAVAEKRPVNRSPWDLPHLPQGAPTSPALANLAAYRLDCRLAGLAAAAGASYTRYADDLAFSGDRAFGRGAERLAVQIGAIALEEGFEVNSRKTRAMPRSVRQHAAGIVLNERPNLPRPEFDRLKAILHNCARFGPASQNREGHADFPAHLAGRIAHVASIHPARGAKLREWFERIVWD